MFHRYTRRSVAVGLAALISLLAMPTLSFADNDDGGSCNALLLLWENWLEGGAQCNDGNDGANGDLDKFTKIAGPVFVRKGSNVACRATTVSSVPTPVTVTIYGDGRVLDSISADLAPFDILALTIDKKAAKALRVACVIEGVQAEGVMTLYRKEGKPFVALRAQ